MGQTCGCCSNDEGGVPPCEHPILVPDVSESKLKCNNPLQRPLRAAEHSESNAPYRRTDNVPCIEVTRSPAEPSIRSGLSFGQQPSLDEVCAGDPSTFYAIPPGAPSQTQHQSSRLFARQSVTASSGTVDSEHSPWCDSETVAYRSQSDDRNVPVEDDL